jgi:hypothetical protein
MMRISAFCLLSGALAVFVLSAQEVSAGPKVEGKPLTPKIPQINNVGRSVTAEQQLSFWGVHTVIERKRDRLQRASSGAKAH